MTWLFITLAVVYFIGLLTISYMDELMRVERRDPIIHYTILIIMFIFTPVLLIIFIIQVLVNFFRKAILK